MGEQEAREAPGERRLADPLRSAEDPGLRQPVAPIGVEQLALRRGMAEKRERLARMRRVVEPVALGRAGGSLLIARRRLRVEEAGLDELPDRLRDLFPGRPASTTQQRSGSCSAMSRKARRSPS